MQDENRCNDDTPSASRLTDLVLGKPSIDGVSCLLMEVPDILMLDCLFRVRYFAFSYSFSTTLDIVYVDSDKTLGISFSHNTRWMVSELSVNTASCFRSVLPLDITVCIGPWRVTRPQTFNIEFVSSSYISDTIVML